ncbi:MAG TPA: hypothetical protein PLG21_17915 [Anaerolineae bacterium]|nr:hypothetical protein [Anaerolineae bacterium]
MKHRLPRDYYLSASPRPFGEEERREGPAPVRYTVATCPTPGCAGQVVKTAGSRRLCCWCLAAGVRSELQERPDLPLPPRRPMEDGAAPEPRREWARYYRPKGEGPADAPGGKGRPEGR